MPVPGGLDDGPQVRVLRIPSEDRSGLLRGRHELRRVAGSARALVGGDRVAGHVSRHVNDFLDREADTVAEVEDVVLAAPQEVVEGEDVGTREVADMDVVADTGAVFGRVVRTEHRDALPLPVRDLQQALK